MSEGALASPGTDRIVTFRVNGHSFGFRRPSRADQREVWGRFAQKLSGPGLVSDPVTGVPTEANLRNVLDGHALHWEARLEVGLVPRRTAGGQMVHLGERAPSHWIEVINDPDGKEIDRRVSFDDVDEEEFDAVVSYLDQALKKKESPTSASSTGSAGGPSSARSGKPGSDGPTAGLSGALRN